MPEPGVHLSWIPLGAGTRAGARVVRTSGRIYEALVAARDRRPRFDLYHGALAIATDAGSFVVEVAPVPDGHGRARRGVVAGGPVGMRGLGRWRIFRYEVRRWPDGAIPDLAYAVASPVRVTADADLAEQVLELLAEVPTPVWGRDELRAGEMWNSNSVVAWVLARAGLDAAAGPPPAGGRAPGWDAGLTVARRAAAGGRAAG